MKKILVPTDFSTVADNAIKHAIEIAAKFNCELYLYHVYSFDRDNYNLNFPEDEQPYIKQVENSMNNTKLKFIEKITQHRLSVQTMVERNNIFSLFGSKVQELGIDFIVMGSKGASGLTKVFFGSVTTTALDMVKVPVLVIPPKYAFRQLKHIVLAIDHKEVSPETIVPLQNLILKFGAKVTLLNVNTYLKKNAFRNTNLYLDEIETEYREIPLTKSINESIQDFIEKGGCDLLCMVRREKSFFEIFFNKSITKIQAFNSQIPLLVLPENGKIFED